MRDVYFFENKEEISEFLKELKELKYSERITELTIDNLKVIIITEE